MVKCHVMHAHAYTHTHRGRTGRSLSTGTLIAPWAGQCAATPAHCKMFRILDPLSIAAIMPSGHCHKAKCHRTAPHPCKCTLGDGESKGEGSSSFGTKDPRGAGLQVGSGPLQAKAPRPQSQSPSAGLASPSPTHPPATQLNPFSLSVTAQLSLLMEAIPDCRTSQLGQFSHAVPPESTRTPSSGPAAAATLMNVSPHTGRRI